MNSFRIDIHAGHQLLRLQRGIELALGMRSKRVGPECISKVLAPRKVQAEGGRQQPAAEGGTAVAGDVEQPAGTQGHAAARRDPDRPSGADAKPAGHGGGRR